MEFCPIIDLFCGCGGFSAGFAAAGCDISLAIDNWKDALDTYRFNFGSEHAVLAELPDFTPERASMLIGGKSVDVIIGGPPCQGFSIAGKRRLHDERNRLYSAFVEYVKYFNPNAFIMENVPNLISINKGSVRRAVEGDFRFLGYKVVCALLTACDYGVPQKRKRVFFIGLKNREFNTSGLKRMSYITSGEAISDLPEYTVEDGGVYPLPPQSEYQAAMRMDSSGLYNHQATKHAEKTCSIINLVPDGGDYRNLPPELKDTRKVHVAWTRLDSRKPAFTIDTGHRHHFHYKYNRVPTARESARLQSFPDNFIFKGSKTSQYRQIGNAVPPLLSKALADAVLEEL